MALLETGGGNLCQALVEKQEDPPKRGWRELPTACDDARLLYRRDLD